jgi:hypothetical protein
MTPTPARPMNGGDWPRQRAYALVTKDRARYHSCRSALICSPFVPEACARPGGRVPELGSPDLRWRCDALGDDLSIEIRQGSAR